MTLTAPRRRTRMPVATPRVAILAASEVRASTPRALTPIGGRPVLWHSMMHFAASGLNQFVVGLGCQGDQLRRSMFDYCERDNLKVSLVDTELEITSSARLSSLREHLGHGSFLLTTGEGVSDIDLDDLLAFHRSHGRLATAVAVRPEARFGKLELKGDQVVEFTEKPAFEQGWTSASFYVLEPGIFDYISCEDGDWEAETLERLARDGQLMAYKHDSFWQGVKTLRDRQELEELWLAGAAPWKNWA